MSFVSNPASVWFICRLEPTALAEKRPLPPFPHSPQVSNHTSFSCDTIRTLRLNLTFISLSFHFYFQLHFLFVFMLPILLLCFSFSLTLLSSIRLFCIVTNYSYLFTAHIMFISRTSSFVLFALLFYELSNLKCFFSLIPPPLYTLAIISFPFSYESIILSFTFFSLFLLLLSASLLSCFSPCLKSHFTLSI
jgi:hypothetical protein